LVGYREARGATLGVRRCGASRPLNCRPALRDHTMDLARPKPPQCCATFPARRDCGPSIPWFTQPQKCRKVRGRTLRDQNLRNVAQRSYFKRCGSSIPWFAQPRNAARSHHGRGSSIPWFAQPRNAARSHHGPCATRAPFHRREGREGQPAGESAPVPHKNGCSTTPSLPGCAPNPFALD